MMTFSSYEEPIKEARKAGAVAKRMGFNRSDNPFWQTYLRDAWNEGFDHSDWYLTKKEEGGEE